MEKEVQKQILLVLSKVQPALKTGDTTVLNQLSNGTIEQMSLYQDQDSISVAVIIYSLSKMCNKPRICNTPQFIKMRKNIAAEFKEAQHYIKNQDVKNYRRKIRKIFTIIGSFDKKFGMYITEVLQQAKIKKGGRMFAQGLSAGIAAQLMGISKWELLGYLGATKLIEVKAKQKPTLERLAYARRIFSL